MNKSFIQSLPLVASALGRKYGIKVVIGGGEAATNGDTIYLPGLPLDSSPTVVAMARGFLDHEAAHIRETNFRAVKAAKLNPLEMHLWNCIEDWRVEKILGDAFPGCRRNFQWLINHLFMREKEGDSKLDTDILNWVLLTLRSWALPELQSRVEAVAERVDRAAPLLLGRLQVVMENIRSHCPDSKTAINHARDLVTTLQDFLQDCETPKPKVQEPSTVSVDQPRGCIEPEEFGDQASEAIKSLLNRNAGELPKGTGQLLQNLLNEVATDKTDEHLKTPKVCPREFGELSEAALGEARRLTLALQSRLKSFLQSQTLKRIQPGLRGRLDPNSLHRLSVGNPRVFKRSGDRVGFDTAVHLLLDASGSMRGNTHLVSLAAYSLCAALHREPGLNVAASVFPGGKPGGPNGRGKNWSTIAPLLKHGETPHRKFHLEPFGGTPLGEAVWWAMGEMAPLKSRRKIILILTDGDPDSMPNAQAAIAAARRQGIEVYGLGLGCRSVELLLPKRCAIIDKLGDVPAGLFGLLSKAMKTAA